MVYKGSRSLTLELQSSSEVATWMCRLSSSSAVLEEATRHSGRTRKRTRPTADNSTTSTPSTSPKPPAAPQHEPAAIRSAAALVFLKYQSTVSGLLDPAYIVKAQEYMENERFGTAPCGRCCYCSTEYGLDNACVHMKRKRLELDGCWRARLAGEKGALVGRFFKVCFNT